MAQLSWNQLTICGVFGSGRKLTLTTDINLAVLTIWCLSSFLWYSSIKFSNFNEDSNNWAIEKLWSKSKNNILLEPFRNKQNWDIAQWLFSHPKLEPINGSSPDNMPHHQWQISSQTRTPRYWSTKISPCHNNFCRETRVPFREKAASG